MTKQTTQDKAVKTTEINATSDLNRLKAVLTNAVKFETTVSECVTGEMLLKIAFFGLDSDNAIETVTAKEFKARNSAFNLARMAAFGAWLATRKGSGLLAQLTTWTKNQKSGNEVVNLRAYRVEDKCTAKKSVFSVRYSDSYNAYWSIFMKWLEADTEAVFASIKAETFHADFMAQKYAVDQEQKAAKEAEAEAVKKDGADKTDPEGNDIELPPEASEALQVLFNRIGNYKRAIRSNCDLLDGLDIVTEQSDIIQGWTTSYLEMAENQAKIDDDEPEAEEAVAS